MRVTYVILLVACLMPLSAAVVLAADYAEDFTKYADNGNAVPDFSEHYGPGWRNYCAPTVAANCVYYFGMSGHPNLLKNNPIGPDPAPSPPPGLADAGANSIIAGVNSPPPIAGSLAQLMGTAVNGGTTAANMRAGLDSYLAANDPFAGANSWNTALVLNTDPGMTAQALWDYMKDELYKCENVLPLIQWPNGPPQGGTGYEWKYDEPDDPVPGSIGHAMTMVGFDDLVAGQEFIYVNDPANNLFPIPQGQWRAWHNWNGEYSKYGVTINNATSTVDFQILGVTASIYGVVSASPVPEPAALVLLVLGAAMMIRRRRR